MGWKEACLMKYTPALLLDAGLDTLIVGHPAFASACQKGFDRDRTVFVDGCSYSWHEVRNEVVGWVFRDYDEDEWYGGVSSLAGRVGEMLGWLSAVHLTQPQEARRGLNLLRAIVPVCQKEEMELVGTCEGLVGTFGQEGGAAC
jgi:hypothetical protein